MPSLDALFRRRTPRPDRAQPRRSYFQRLLRDKAGNGLYITALAVVPITGLTGGAVDLGRTYLVKNRLQQACDAAALAARRAMDGTTLTAADKAEGLRFFRFNFPDGTMGSQPMSSTNGAAANRVTFALEDDTRVRVRATTSVPTTLLKVANVQDMRVNVECIGEEFFVNTDLMLVLDTTGSMNCAISDPLTCGQENEKSNSKMLDLRNVVKEMYEDLRPAQVALEDIGMRMRIGFVQYASNANVGKLIYAASPTYLNNRVTMTAPGAYKTSGGPDGTKVDGPVQTAAWFTGNGASDWNGCIVERQTTPTITATSTSIPPEALDLDIATMPTDEASRWTPHVPALMRKVHNGATSYDNAAATTGGFNACTKPAVHMKSWGSLTEFNNHVDTITKGVGGTYHDIGMIWGTRMIAPMGIFGSLNPTIFNNAPVKKTIVLVTDGIIAPDTRIYSAYGVEQFDDRVYPGAVNSPSSPDPYRAIHERRFTLACTQAKGMGIDIWVIAILPSATAMPASLTQCATGGQARKVSNADALSEAFNAIANKVGHLRVGA